MSKGFKVERKSLLVVVFIIAATFANAQSYTITPGHVLSRELHYSQLSHFNIQQNNLTPGHLIFSWRKVRVDVPAGWAANLCDNGNCYPDFPESGTMDSVYTGEYGLMSAAINPGLIPGKAFIQYVLWERNSQNLIDTLTWIISTKSASGITENEGKNNIRVFSNSANNSIHIITNYTEGFSYSIYDLKGLLMCTDKKYSESAEIPASDFLDGYYCVLIISKDNSISQKIVIHH